MIDHGIGIDTSAELAAGDDETTEILPSPHPTLESIRNRLVHEIPRVEDIVEGLIRHDLLLRGEYLHACWESDWKQRQPAPSHPSFATVSHSASMSL